MLKKIIVFWSVILTSLVFAQVNDNGDQLNDVVETADKIPEFPGGIYEYQNQFVKVFRYEKFEGKGKLRTTIIFILEKDGSITDVKALGGSQLLNDESIRAVKKIKTKWIPAEINGEKVRFRLRFPFSTEIDRTNHIPITL